MRKCTRCSTKLNWDRAYCPMCGGSTMIVEDDRPRPSVVPRPQVPAQVETPPPVAPEAVTPAAASSIPGLEYLDDEPEQRPMPAAAAVAPAAPAQAPERLELSADISGASFGGFSAGASAPAAKSAPVGERLELSGDIASTASASMTSAFGEAKPAPAPQAAREEPLSIADEPAPMGEFLKMFPDAKPE